MVDSGAQLLTEVFGAENLGYLVHQRDIVMLKQEKLAEMADLQRRARAAFGVNLTGYDIAIPVIGGVLVGLGTAMFSEWDWTKVVKHQHGTTRTAVDHGIPKPAGFKGHVNDLHRQIGPSHDLFRFREALKLMSGETADFDLWGSSIVKILGHGLRPGNMKQAAWEAVGGQFRIPADPAAELLNHLWIDFWTKRSLPLPGSTWIADHSDAAAKVMLELYQDGLNLRTMVGNVIGAFLIEAIVRVHFFFKAWRNTNFRIYPLEEGALGRLFAEAKRLRTTNEYRVCMMMAHGTSVLVSSAIIVGNPANHGLPWRGLTKLNYASIMALGWHTLRYLVDSGKKANELMDQARLQGNEILLLDDEWVRGFMEHSDRTLGRPEVAQLLDPGEWTANDERVERLRTTTLQKLALLHDIQEA